MKGFAENLCSHGGDMLAYLYDEMASADRERFELHLSDCGTCIDDFAELSQSRYPVYEWKQTEFDPLPTPRIALPYSESSSWVDRLRAAFAFPRGLVLGGAAASLLIAMTVGYFALSTPDVDIANEVEPIPSPAKVVNDVLPPVVPREPEVPVARAEPQIGTERPKSANVNAPAKRRPEQVAGSRRLTPPKKDTETFPVYTAMDDDEDESLRLADMFDELGTSEE